MYGWTIPSDEVILRLRKDLARTGTAASRQLWQYPPDPSRLKVVQDDADLGTSCVTTSVCNKAKNVELSLRPDIHFPVGHGGHSKLYGIAGGASTSSWTAV